MTRPARSPLSADRQRHAALQAVPHCAPFVRREEKNGKLYITVRFERPRWQRALGAQRECERTFGLDLYGRRVYECCDGGTPVTGIINLFARQSQISRPEAELAVTRFIRTLLSKGLVVMEMEKLRA